MPPLLAVLVGALALAALNTFGDFLWARFVSQHRTVLGLIHGTVLLLALGLFLGLLRSRPLRGALSGAAVGLLAALSFYALAPLLEDLDGLRGTETSCGSVRVSTLVGARAASRR